MKIYNPIKTISNQIKYNQLIKPAVQYSKERAKALQRAQQKRFMATRAGYFPKQKKKLNFFQKLLRNIKDYMEF